MTAKGIGSLSAQNSDIDITVGSVASEKSMAPTRCVFSRSPDDRLVECGGTWNK
tara:strand:+ start:12728 stop:12889 length:162 start_codon:yes stop_codon:yes gene_type:complete